MQFSEWKHNIDCEYNREREYPKKRIDNSKFRPGIIIHERGNNDNN